MTSRRILLVRHARAGDRERWRGDDRLRPLDARGRLQAAALPSLLAAQSLARVVSSPYLRCVETVEPLAALAGLRVEHDDRLAEDTGDAIFGLLRELADGSVICTHGDVVETLVGVGQPKQKGSTWLLEIGPGDRVARVEYLPPPA